MNHPMTATSQTPPKRDLSFLFSRAALKRIALITLGGAVIGLLYGLFAPKWYRSVLTVVPVKQQKSGLSGLLGGDLGGLASGLNVGGGATDVTRIAAVLESIAVSDAVIARFDLRKRYDEKYQETTRQSLWDHCNVKALSKPNLVRLSCEDKDPRFVQQMLEYFAEYGNQVFRRVSVSTASEEARFLDARVAALRGQADQAATQMREFQEKHRIVDIETQSKAVVSAMASLNAQRISKQLELGYMRSFSSGDDATTQQLQSQLSVMERKLRDLENPREPTPTSAGKASEGGVFPAALAVPKLRSEYETLYRNRKVAEASLIFALERLETAKADEARDVSTFMVLDPPTLPTRRSRPRLSISLLVATFAALTGAIAYEWLRSPAGRAALAPYLPAPKP